MIDLLIERLNEIANRDTAAAVTVRADDLRALLAALEAAREDAWQPIETAPKDGSMYLCWVDAIRYGERDDGSIDSADVSEVDFGQWQSCSVAEDGGYHQNMMGSIGDCQIITHWRPPPAPPAIDQARGKGGKEVGNG